MTEGQRLLNQYLERLQFPELAPAEAVELLEIRSSLALWEPEFGEEEATRLADADDMLLRLAPRLQHAVNKLGPLGRLREERRVPPGHWWWNLERLG